MVSGLSEASRLDVVTEVYRRADDLDWGGLTDKQRTIMYDRWLDEPAIGGKLTPFMSRERARVWLKDTPMKEYARARNGIGPYKHLVWSRFPGPEQIARQVLGRNWSADEATLEEKPIRCRITNGHDNRLMTWGPSATLRDMVWAGINALADREPTPLLVVAAPYERMPDDAEKRRQVLLGEISGLEVRHAVLKVVKVIPDRCR